MLKRLFNNKGFLNFGGSYSKEKSESRTETGLDYMQKPEFKETDEARQTWWQQLQSFAGQPGYGAISPDWADIWQNAQKKVQQYFWGSPTDPGLAGKVKASAARRGVSESPAMENSLLKMGATESGVMSDLATQEATNKATFAEQGRQNYLQQLMQLSNTRSQGQFWNPWQTNQSSGSSWGLTAKVGDELPAVD